MRITGLRNALDEVVPGFVSALEAESLDADCDVTIFDGRFCFKCPEAQNVVLIEPGFMRRSYSRQWIADAIRNTLSTSTRIFRCKIRPRADADADRLKKLADAIVGLQEVSGLVFSFDSYAVIDLLSGRKPAPFPLVMVSLASTTQEEACDRLKKELPADAIEAIE